MKNHKKDRKRKYSHWMSNNSFEIFFFKKSYCFLKRCYAPSPPRRNLLGNSRMWKFLYAAWTLSVGRWETILWVSGYKLMNIQSLFIVFSCSFLFLMLSVGLREQWREALDERNVFVLLVLSSIPPSPALNFKLKIFSLGNKKRNNNKDHSLTQRRDLARRIH